MNGLHCSPFINPCCYLIKALSILKTDRVCIKLTGFIYFLFFNRSNIIRFNIVFFTVFINTSYIRYIRCLGLCWYAWHSHGLKALAGFTRRCRVFGSYEFRPPRRVHSTENPHQRICLSMCKVIIRFHLSIHF